MRAFSLLLLACAVAAVAAVPCENFNTEATCNGKATSSGECGWDGAACVVIAPLPPGMAGIATVGPEEPVLVEDPVPVAGAPAASADASAPTPEAAPDAFCTLPPETGPCRAAMPSFHFDASAGACKPFLYGGCQGNANRFETEEACQEAAALFCSAAPSPAPDARSALADRLAAGAEAVMQATGGSAATRAGVALAALAAAAAALIVA